MNGRDLRSSGPGVIVWMAIVSLLFACSAKPPETQPPVPYGSWGSVLPASHRFAVIMDGQAVVDRETGLVWERSPHSERMDWTDACAHCYRKEAGLRMGWRLPAVEELSSLVDPTGSESSLPPGHPFEGIHPLVYWSATTDNGYDGLAWRVYFSEGQVGRSVKSIPYSVWCVRGGS